MRLVSINKLSVYAVAILSWWLDITVVTMPEAKAAAIVWLNSELEANVIAVVRSAAPDRDIIGAD